ncbi:MAG: murein biosynthesis integral membrane protein MurJ [Alphaproteobacteria bacterium]|nr:murein biosynthesis integral membrane protein MurJ [Alphaproteobacteria bacterium]
MINNRLQFLKKTLWVAIFTIGSRILGYFRERMLAQFLGVCASTDALLIAIKLPSFFRRSLAEGALSSSFVPILSSELHNKENQSSLILTSLAFLALALAPLIFSFEIWTDSIITTLFPKLTETPTRLQLTIHFSRIIFPFIGMISLASLFSGILQSHLRFNLVASAPMMGNLSLIITGLCFLPAAEEKAGAIFAWSVLVSGCVHFLWVCIPAIRLIPRGGVVNFSSPAFQKFIKNFFPGVIGTTSLQINILIDTIFITLLGVGGASYLSYADRIIQLPISVISASLSLTLLPALTLSIAQKEKQMFDKLFALSISFCLIFAIPASLACLHLSAFLIRALYNYGSFSQEHITPTAHTLMAFALGLPAFLLSKVLSTLFFAHKDTRTPALITLISVSICIISNLILLKSWQHIGLALSTTISAYVHTLCLYVIAKRRKILPNKLSKKIMLSRIIITNILFFLFIKYTGPMLVEYVYDWNRFVGICALVGFIVMVYSIIAFSCGLWGVWRKSQ